MHIAVAQLQMIQQFAKRQGNYYYLSAKQLYNAKIFFRPLKFKVHYFLRAESSAN